MHVTKLHQQLRCIELCYIYTRLVLEVGEIVLYIFEVIREFIIYYSLRISMFHHDYISYYKAYLQYVNELDLHACRKAFLMKFACLCIL